MGITDDIIPDSLILDESEPNLEESFELLSRHDRVMLWAGVKDGRRIVLKGLPEGLRSHPEEVARLRKEYQLGMRIDHRGVVRVYWFEQHARFGPVIVMEYVDGLPLNRYLSRETQDGNKSAGKLPPLAERRRIAFEIADALAAVHAAGVSHRDLKPDNILVGTRTHSPRIIDFGHGDADDYIIYKNSLATERYGAPEQQQPAVGDMSSDVYSFGKILEELLPERRFRGLRCACLTENADARPTMESVAARLNPSSGRRTRQLVAIVALAVIAFIGGAIVHRFFTPDTLPPQESEVPLVSDEAQNPDNSVEQSPEQENTAPTPPAQNNEIKPAETVAPISDTKSAPKSLDNVMEAYYAKLDAMFKKYGPLDQHTYQEDIIKMQRYEQALGISKKLEKDLTELGMSKNERVAAIQQFWTYYQFEMIKIDGNDKLIEQYSNKNQTDEGN